MLLSASVVHSMVTLVPRESHSMPILQIQSIREEAGAQHYQLSDDAAKRHPPVFYRPISVTDGRLRPHVAWTQAPLCLRSLHGDLRT